ncbi:MAG: amidohydrolase family protein [Candidatus Sumerlaeaceae bacterium]|nr:amidohydrolase family protein [Candidatus Sumerlaeaceae bacterium]
MGIVLTNALLTDMDPPRVESGALRLANGLIAARAADLTPQPGDEVMDCGGAVVLPGMVNGHTHLYSALAPGMPAPPVAPRNFLEILRFVWWRLDRALDAESIEMSALVGALDALHCGTTTLVDHHASPNAIAGSLDRIEAGIAAAGLRGVLCYETTDRQGRDGREAGLEENRRYLSLCAHRRDGRFAALVGGHAAFTCDADTLEAISRLAEQFDAGVHIHAAEDGCDDAICREKYGRGLVERLTDAGLFNSKTILAHAVHLAPEGIERANAAALTVAHNTRSNMNNAVGYAPLNRLRCPVALGTDGIGSDMWTECATAWFKSRDGGAGRSPADILAMLAQASRRASLALGIPLGRLQPGSAADIVITDYRPATPLQTENLAGHLIFAIGARYVRHVLVGGKWKLRDRQAVSLDEPAVRRAAMDCARGLWQRMAALD